MPAYDFFAATTTNLFIDHIKTKAEAYGWTIDTSSVGRLHLHNADGAHFEIYYYSDTAAGIRGCTGYSSGAASTAQPNISGECKITSSQPHFIAIGPHAIFIKVFSSGTYQNMQFGSIVDKVGAWAGGICVSSTTAFVGNYGYTLWHQPYLMWNSQVYINGTWSALRTDEAGAVTGYSAGSLFAKMPFVYSGGILPCPILLARTNPSTPAYLDPIGYAPDSRLFSGGDVYASLEEILINGEKWIGISQAESGVTFAASPDLLIRLAS